MNLPFTVQNDLVLGLDIGSHSVKICQLKPNSGKHTVVAVGSAILPEGAVDDGVLNDPEVIREAIFRLINDLKLKNKKVGFSISGYSVIVKKLTLPVMDDAKLEKHIMEEAEQYIPFDIEEVYLDFQDLKTSTKDLEKTSVILVAAKKDIVDDYLYMLRSLNLDPTIADVNGFALENSYGYSNVKGENIALVDIGAANMRINILSQGISAISRDIIVGSGQLTDRIQNAFDIDFDEAEALKLGTIAAEDKRLEIEDIFLSTCTQWTLEIKKAIDLYHSKHPNQPLKKLVLSGGGAKVAGLTDFLAGETDLAVDLFNPFSNMLINKKKIDPDYLYSIGPEMAIVAGIALRSSIV